MSQYWSILEHFWCTSIVWKCDTYILKNMLVYSEAYNTGTQKWSSIVQYSYTSIWDLKYTFSLHCTYNNLTYTKCTSYSINAKHFIIALSHTIFLFLIGWYQDLSPPKWQVRVMPLRSMAMSWKKNHEKVQLELQEHFHAGASLRTHHDTYVYAISHITLIHTLCLSKYVILPIKLSSDARSLQNLSPWNSKSVWIMPSVLTCAVIYNIVWTLTCFNGVRIWLNNIKLKFLCEKPASFCHFNLWKSAVFICCCYKCLVLWLRSSVKLVHNCPGSLQNSSKFKVFNWHSPNMYMVKDT